MPSNTTDPATKNKTLVGNDFATNNRDGRLIEGNVIRSAAAGPPPSPKDMNVWMIGISAAVGITNNIPAIAKIIIVKMVLADASLTCGNNQTRIAPINRTDRI